jgi:hypothetical protein
MKSLQDSTSLETQRKKVTKMVNTIIFGVAAFTIGMCIGAGIMYMGIKQALKDFE